MAQVASRLSETRSITRSGHPNRQRKCQNHELLLMCWAKCRRFVSSTSTSRYQDNFPKLSAILDGCVRLRRLLERQHAIDYRL